MSNQKWHQYLCKTFRSHLFKFVGCYEMTLCFLIALLNSETLKIFQLAIDETSHLSHDVNRSQKCLERFTTLGREAVAAPETRNASLCPPRLLEARPKTLTQPNVFSWRRLLRCLAMSPLQFVRCCTARDGEGFLRPLAAIHRNR